MKIPLSWLRDYIDLDLAPTQIANILTSAGLEVDDVETTSPGFEKVIVGEVTHVEKHPNADKLCVATVSNGGETFQVVCGAPNCRAGLKTAFAVVGAVLKDEKGQPFKVKHAKLRGVESAGMLCSSEELGLGNESDGIIEFADHIKVGTDIAEMYADVIFNISLTPNLNYCSSVIGVARELSAMTGKPFKLPSVHFKEAESEQIQQLVDVKVEDSEGCPRYACRMIKDVQIQSSPDWIKNRLLAAGIRPINNIVDITNYILIESGHPLHAFDYDKLEGHGIIVRSAKEGERFVTLDEKERKLEAGDLLICDKKNPIALAGIMGGLNSEVGETTKNVLLEAAYFHPGRIRKTSKHLGLQTEASRRFERGADPNGVLFALDRAAVLLTEIAGGKVAKGVVDVKATHFPEKTIACRLTRINNILGTQLSVSEVETIFKHLKFVHKWDGKDTFNVTIPTYRVDVGAEIDLIEDVARVYGYNNISRTASPYFPSTIPNSPLYLFEREIRSRLIAEGLQEFITCDLIGPTLSGIVKEHLYRPLVENSHLDCAKTPGLSCCKGGNIGQYDPLCSSLNPGGFRATPNGNFQLEAGMMPPEAIISVLNPTSIEQSILRTSLLPGLLQLVKYNIDHQNHNVSGFEIGRIHFKEGDQYKEQTVLGIVLTGKNAPHSWEHPSHDVDFFDLKGILENLFQIGIHNVTFKPSQFAVFHSGRQAFIHVNNQEIGSIGEIHPMVQRRLDVTQRIQFVELNLQAMLQLRKTGSLMQELPLYPCSERDWTMTVKEETPIQDTLESIQKTASKLLEKVFLLDVYRSDKLGKGNKNVTLRFVYRDNEKTISQEVVEAEHKRIIDKITLG
jgi:phenylalanyl-tRNA synthetase beta chain